MNRLIPIMLADTYEEFQARYLQAFGAPNLRQLFRTCPTNMTLDDRGMEGNWTHDRLTEAGKHRLFNLAIGAYMSCQWSRGPRMWGRLLYYQLACARYAFFILDTRTRRFTDNEEDIRDSHLLGRPTTDPAHPSQLSRLLDRLSEQQQTRDDASTFMVSASVLPRTRSMNGLMQACSLRD